ncbi:hypothetical protein [Ramlibacter albus]|uniref:SH3 domain-containing protein n=1 Tax=Ramlibacter albus TaxID=2079448 RepID=A0A923M6F0_9BURK|nr:hypothetical protein [Ramlibacter albus]MBC5765087.1 hypothetical protein [Ramlibacter albus]
MLATALALSTALVTTDAAVLRAAPRESAQQQAQLWQGELLEVRGERLDWLQVWDHRRERGGFVRASQVRRTALNAAEAPELLAVLRFVRESAGNEALGIALAGAWLQAAPAEAVRGEAGVEALDAIGTLADRLAQRASSAGAGQGSGVASPVATPGKGAQAAIAAHLDVAAQYGVKFTSYEREGRMQVCYDGDAFRRVLALESQPAQRARAALALTRTECIDPNLQPLARHKVNAWRAQVLDRVDVSTLPAYTKNRIAMRRASVWSTLAYEHARLGDAASRTAAQRALDELASVHKSELPEEDAPLYNEAAMRVNASRWAAVVDTPAQPAGNRPAILTVRAQPGVTCVLLVDAKADISRPLAKRCTFAQVWPQSASLNREGNALALAVQPMESWRELWLFRKTERGWAIDVLPPASVAPELGYAEFAGWVPGGQQVLVAREARGEGKYKRNYEVMNLDTLTVQRQTGDASTLGPFQRWQDPAWKRTTVSLR